MNKRCIYYNLSYVLDIIWVVGYAMLKNDNSTGVSLSVTRFNSMEGVDHWQLGASHITVTLHDVTS